MRIIEMSGAGVLGRPLSSRTASSCSGLRATSHTSRSFIWPMNNGSLFPQLLLPTYRLARLTGSGKRIVAVLGGEGGKGGTPFEETSVVGVVATLTPSQ